MALFGSKKSRSEKMLDDVDEYIRTANEQLKNGDVDGANSSFRRGRILLQKFDTSDMPDETANRYTRIAYGIMETGDDEIAMECADKALELNKKEIDAYLVKGAIYLKRTKMYNQAILSFNDALKINPRHEKALELKAGALEKRKQYKKAYQLYKQLIEISDNPEKYQARIDSIKKRMKLKRAGQRSTEEKKDVKISMAAPPGARKEEAAKPKPEPEVTAPPAEPEIKPEEPKKVDDLLNDVLETVGVEAPASPEAPEPEPVVKEITEPAPAGEPEPEPDSEPVVEETSEPAAEEGEVPEPVVEEPPEVEPAPEAVGEPEEPFSPEGESPEAQPEMAPAEQSVEAVQEPEEIPEPAQEAVEETPAEEPAPEHEEAEEAIEIDIEQVRKEANAAFEDDDYEKAEELYEQLAVAGENDIDLYYNLGVCYYSNGRVEDAVEVFDAILDADPDDTDSWLTKGAAHFALKQYDKAIDAFNNVLKRNAGEDAAWYYKACSEALRGNAKLALTFLERAISMDENYRDIAADDESFASLKDDPKFRQIVGQA